MPSNKKCQALSNTHRKQLGDAGKQAANISENNADVLAALVTNTLRTEEPTSARSNPAKSTRNVKHDYAYETREKVKQHLQIPRAHIEQELTPALVQLAAQWPKVALDGIRDTLLGIRGEMATLTVNVGLLKSHGWSLHRLSDFSILAAKGIVHRAATAIMQKAPAVLVNTTVHQMTASFSQETLKDAKVILSRDEIHRLANLLSVDAKAMTLLLKELAAIRSAQEVEIAAGQKATLSGKDTVEIVSGDTIKSSAKMHSICDMGGGSIKVSNGVIDLNPMGAPPMPTIPVVVLPVVLAEHGDGKLAGVQAVPQYEGMGAQGTSFA